MILKNKDKKEFKVSEKSIPKYLGPYRFRQEQVEKEDQVGMVTGLAWTQVGGELGDPFHGRPPRLRY